MASAMVGLSAGSTPKRMNLLHQEVEWPIPKRSAKAMMTSKSPQPSMVRVTRDVDPRRASSLPTSMPSPPGLVVSGAIGRNGLFIFLAPVDLGYQRAWAGDVPVRRVWAQRSFAR